MDNTFDPGTANGDRCIQMYTDPDRGLIEGNVFDRCNDVAVHFSGRSGAATNDVTVSGNVIAHTREEYNVDTYTGQTTASAFSGNVVRDNCAITTLDLNDNVDRSGIQAGMPGATLLGNVAADPQLDEQSRIKAGTPCAAKFTGPSENTYAP
jgi:hypothetical protein